LLRFAPALPSPSRLIMRRCPEKTGRKNETAPGHSKNGPSSSSPWEGLSHISALTDLSSSGQRCHRHEGPFQPIRVWRTQSATSTLVECRFGRASFTLTDSRGIHQALRRSHGLASRLKIEAREPAVKHTVTLAQLQRWANAATKSPAERLKREHLRQLLAGE
jgi:hypothetical protein